MASLPAGKGVRRARRAAPRPTHAVPTIVFHGDQDHTVHARNGEAIVEQFRAVAGTAGRPELDASRQQGVSPGGRAFSRAALADAAGRPVIEHWVLHGAGHAWAGGSDAGSYTDPSGPDASAEMVRFFLAQAANA